MSFVESGSKFTFSVTVLNGVLDHGGGGYVLSSIDLNRIIGNDNGVFVWGGEGGYAWSSSNSRLEIEGSTAKLVADLAKKDGSMSTQSLVLNDRISNVRGQFVFE